MDTLYFLEHDCELVGAVSSEDEARSWLGADILRSVTKVEYIKNDRGERVICRVNDLDFETFVRTRLVRQPYRVMRYLEILLEFRNNV